MEAKIFFLVIVTSLFSNISVIFAQCPSPACTVCNTDLTGVVVEAQCISVTPLDIPDTVRDLTISTNCIPGGLLSAFYLYRKTVLHSLTLRSCGITSFMADPFLRQSNLTVLDLQSNGIAKITSTGLQSLHSLETLALDGNVITNISAGAFNALERLRVLTLTHNRIVEVDETYFQDLVSLETLDLSNNDITIISENAFRDLYSVREINLSYNHLGTIGISFQNLSRMATLSLQENRIQHIHNSAFSGTMLHRLDLSSNQLSRIPGDALRSCYYTLRYIEMMSNPIEILYNRDFIGLLIVSLDLRACQIHEIENDAFQGCRLYEMNLEYNSLNTLPYSVKTLYDTGGNIYIRNNIWNCTCSSKWIGDFIISVGSNYRRYKRLSHLPDPVCAGPTDLTGFSLPNASQILESRCPETTTALYTIVPTSNSTTKTSPITTTHLTSSTIATTVSSTDQQSYISTTEYFTTEATQTYSTGTVSSNANSSNSPEQPNRPDESNSEIALYGGIGGSALALLSLSLAGLLYKLKGGNNKVKPIDLRQEEGLPKENSYMEIFHVTPSETENVPPLSTT